MKSATIPALRVEPELREAVEDVLGENETLSSFMESALRAGVGRRRHQREFIARGLAAREDPFLRESLVSFGSLGYVVLFEVDDETTASMLAIRHQLEEDYQ